MTPLSPQHPTRRRVALRPRGDVFTVPTGHPHEPREYREPIDEYDSRNEPRAFEWAELREPTTLIGGLLMFLAIVAFIVFAGISW